MYIKTFSNFELIYIYSFEILKLMTINNQYEKNNKSYNKFDTA